MSETFSDMRTSLVGCLDRSHWRVKIVKIFSDSKTHKGKDAVLGYQFYFVPCVPLFLPFLLMQTFPGKNFEITERQKMVHHSFFELSVTGLKKQGTVH